MVLALKAEKSCGKAWQDAAALSGMLDGLRIAITIFDGQERLLYANAHLNYLFRSLPPHHQLIGRSYQEMIELEIAGGEIAPSVLAPGISAFISQRRAQLREKGFAPCDVPTSDHRVVEIKARQDRQGRTVLQWSDVTAARAQLARLQEAVALSAEAFAFYDASDRLILANELYLNLCGMKTSQELLGKSFTEIATDVAFGGHIVLDETPQQWLERHLRGHRDPTGAVTLRTRSGAAYLVRDRASPDGGRIMVFTDITDKFRAETALAEQQHALANANAQAEKQKSYLADLTKRLDLTSAAVDSAKTTLLRTMSHEMKTPLNAILGFSHLIGDLADTLTPGQVREYAGLIHQGGKSLFKIINQIMDLTKISAGRYDLHRTRVDAGGLLGQAAQAFQEQAAARGLVIAPADCPVGLMVHADEAVAAAMVNDLLDNAVSFTTGKHITLSARSGDAGIALTVADDGAGVAPQDLARIQEPFEQLAGTEACQHSKGAGLGLTLVKAFAELHGGRLDLDSRPHAGFRATIVLPAAPITA